MIANWPIFVAVCKLLFTKTNVESESSPPIWTIVRLICINQGFGISSGDEPWSFFNSVDTVNPIVICSLIERSFNNFLLLVLLPATDVVRHLVGSKIDRSVIVIEHQGHSEYGPIFNIKILEVSFE